MNRTIRALAAATLLFAAVNMAADISAAPGQSGGNTARRNARYIVRMAEFPVSSYDGGIPALPATRPARGERVDRETAAVIGYAAYLDSRHDAAVRRVGGRKLYDYRYSFNGFTAELTDAQAEQLKQVAGVLSVTKDELQHANTSNTPAFLGLDDAGGLWDRLGGVDKAGEDVIIGVIDSGIWPESDSFAARRKHQKRDDDGGRYSERNNDRPYHPLKKWKGACETGEQFTAADCNGKLIGARWFNEAWGGDAGLKKERPWEFASARDYNGHGTHTASTAGGNADVVATGPAQIFGRVNGMAPRARIAVYKALWSTQDGSEATGFTSDLVAAIDQAVADGVDVINYSVSGTSTNFVDPAEISFLFAADAGVFVAASAGNDGPAASTVAHPSPWITTVAAGTHNRDGRGSVTLGSGATYTGSSLATALPSTPLIDATAAGLPGANATAVRLCFAASDNGGVAVLDPAKVAGKIVICDRGTNARTNKSLAVKDAGGAGMILVNVTPNSVNADLHFVPTVHLADTARAAIKTYAAGASPTASIATATLVFDVPAPATAAFSSRGPLLAGAGDLLKPDIIAPGQDIVAAVAPPGNHALEFNVYSGTSMSSPHIAGLAALMIDLHKDWTPMMIKSALMTSASDVIDGANSSPSVIFSQGAGHVTPNAAMDPGLVYDSDINDWLAFLCGATTAVTTSTCSALQGAGFSLDPSDMNTPSISIGSLIASQTVTRTVTNVSKHPSLYWPVVSGMTGVKVDVKPALLLVMPGQSRTFTVTFTTQTAAINTYTGGQLTWKDGQHSVRIPLVVKPQPLSAPAQVSGTGGPITYSVKFGYTGPFAASARGLVPAATTNGTVADDPHDDFAPGGPGTVAIPVTIPAGTTYARFSLFDANVTPASDLDLYVYKGTTPVGGSGSGSSAEEVNLLNPAAGSDYIVYVHGFGVTTTANFTLFSWVLGSTAAGNMTVTATPSSATLGATGTVNLTFSGLTAGTKYLGSVAYSGTAGLPNPTIVRVDP